METWQLCVLDVYSDTSAYRPSETTQCHQDGLITSTILQTKERSKLVRPLGFQMNNVVLAVCIDKTSAEGRITGQVIEAKLNAQ